MIWLVFHHLLIKRINTEHNWSQVLCITSGSLTYFLKFPAITGTPVIFQQVANFPKEDWYHWCSYEGNVVNIPNYAHTHTLFDIQFNLVPMSLDKEGKEKVGENRVWKEENGVWGKTPEKLFSHTVFESQREGFSRHSIQNCALY